MPATEQTWRNTRKLHVVFGLTSLAMLGTTFWMLKADHDREYKTYIRTFRNLEAWQAQARVSDQATFEFQDKLAELESALAAERIKPLDGDQLDRFLEIAASRMPGKKDDTFEKVNGYNLKAVERARDAFDKAKDDEARAAARARVIEAMQAVIARAKFAEDTAQRDLKFKRAEADAKRSEFDIAVGEYLSEDELGKLQKEIDRVVKNSDEAVDPLTAAFNEANTHRKQLQLALSTASRDEAAADKALKDHLGKLTQLERAKDERTTTFLKSLLELPIIDAFGGPLKPDQIWLPQLTRFNNFKDVARFDRCITCHRGIDKTAPGSAVNPGYEPRLPMALSIATPTAAPAQNDDESTAELLDRTYGIVLADVGLVEPNEVTVEAVRSLSLAAKAQLKPGDVLREIGGAQVRSNDTAWDYLLKTPRWGQPLALAIERGVPQPYSSHPRLDLFVGSLSPHKMGDVGCTICHEGQGSATAFKWASHTPNNPRQSGEWATEHGWFNNHHWIYPQLPKRFLESNCLKCHHDLTELEPSDKFPDPPAPKLLRGHETILDVGCFGCHEINGFDGPKKRRGPDLRAEPNYFAAAAQLLNDPNLTDEERSLAYEVIAHPENQEARHRLADSVLADDPLAAASAQTDAAPRLASNSYKLGRAIAADEETPGKLRKAGPSLRYIDKKVDLEFLYAWIADPTSFRPSTKMPRFFGLHDHLELDERDPKNPEDALRFEPVEVAAISHYLLNASGKQTAFDYVAPPEGIAEPSVERGKASFERRGCLSCHTHRDFPAAKDKQGPNLSGLGAKFVSREADKGFRWLYSWIREPNRYHARTVMPNVPLVNETGADGATFDQAADIAEYLLSSQVIGPAVAEGEEEPAPWRPQVNVPNMESETNRQALDDLVLMYLKAAVPNPRVAKQYLAKGIPESERGNFKGDELELVGDGQLSDDQKMLYVGRRSIGRLGCTGCHDVPGFEDAKPIGTTLADWGRKEPSKLAFEQIVNYLAKGHSHSDTGLESFEEAYPDEEGKIAREAAEKAGHPHLSPEALDDDTGFFVDAILNHQREGFLWQKLRDPRSYDFRKTVNKDYIDRLRMPKFNLDDAQREAIMTFVLGLVAEPPAAKYVYKADKRRQAILDGKVVLNKYNCAGCHVMQMERWDVQFDPAAPDYAEEPKVDDFAFLAPHFSPAERKAARATDNRGLGHAHLVGRRDVDSPQLENGKDPETNEYFFILWEAANVNGHAWWPAERSIPLPEADIIHQRGQVGGDFARLLYSTALAFSEQTKGLKDFKKENVWGWLPPPLAGEGRKVQTAWLHDFLLDPHEIRPAALLRMPNFRLTSDEATKLVNYFAAVDDVDFPYEYDPRTRSDYLQSQDGARPGRLDDALKIVLDKKTFCANCHRLGDFQPTSVAQAHGPNLDRIYRRLRPDYVRRWIANPRRLLPYTAMPQLFSPSKEQGQELFQGSSQEQIEAVADLLMNYDAYMKRRASVGLISADPPPAETPPEPPTGDAADGESGAETPTTEEAAGQ